MNKAITFILPLVGTEEQTAPALAALQQSLRPQDEAFLPVQFPLALQNPALHRLQTDTPDSVATLCRAAVQAAPQNDLLVLGANAVLNPQDIPLWRAMLHRTEKNGLVVPATNADWLCPLPAEFAPLLPAAQVVPVAQTPVFFIKRELVERYGFLDSRFETAAGAAQELSLRVNQFGFSTVQANRTTVTWSGSARPSQKDEVLLREIYPYYDKNLSAFLQNELTPVQHFAPLLTRKGKKRVLLSLAELPDSYNGTALHCLNLTENFYKRCSEQFEISVVVQEYAESVFHLREKYPNVYLPDELDKQDLQFDIAYSPTQITLLSHLAMLNRHAVKIVVCMQDIIGLRSRYWLVNDPNWEEVNRLALHHADGLIVISDFSYDDAAAFFPEEVEEQKLYHKTVYLAPADAPADAKDGEKLPFDEYFVVMGNPYKHKYLGQIEPWLEKSHKNFIVVGSPSAGQLAPNVYGYPSGGLSGDLMRQIYTNATAVVFPSVYEGFGLPILNALNCKKKVIVDDNTLNRELQDWLKGYEGNILRLTRFEDLETLLDAASAPFGGSAPLHSWEDVADEVAAALNDVLALPVDAAHWQERWRFFRDMEIALQTCTDTPKRRLLRWMKAHVPALYRTLKKRQFAGRVR